MHSGSIPFSTSAAGSLPGELDIHVSEIAHDPELDEAVIAFANADFEQCEQALLHAEDNLPVDNNAQIISRDRRLVPNDFIVELSPADLERLVDYDSAMASELSRQLREHADAQSYVFPGPVTIARAEGTAYTVV